MWRRGRGPPPAGSRSSIVEAAPGHLASAGLRGRPGTHMTVRTRGARKARGQDLLGSPAGGGCGEDARRPPRRAGRCRRRRGLSGSSVRDRRRAPARARSGRQRVGEHEVVRRRYATPRRPARPAPSPTQKRDRLVGVRVLRRPSPRSRARAGSWPRRARAVDRQATGTRPRRSAGRSAPADATGGHSDQRPVRIASTSPVDPCRAARAGRPKPPRRRRSPRARTTSGRPVAGSA